ncbi:MAG: YdcF family protein [Candidatus Riflebacteria bacterium]|nr:YdcF family protein [Candidatus Riflebacteria bacterium]
MKKILIFTMVFAGYLIFPQFPKEVNHEWVDILFAVIVSLILLAPDCWPKPGEGIFRWAIQVFAILFVIATLVEAIDPGAIIGEALMLPHSCDKADAIFVLAAGTQKDGSPGYSGMQRVLHGIELFKEKRAPVLVFSTGKPFGEADEEKCVASITKLLLGDVCNVIFQKNMLDTRGEALSGANILFPRGIKKILLVTNGAHIFRAVKIFEKVGFTVLPAPVQEPGHLKYSLDSSGQLLKSVIHEWIGLMLYYLRGEIEFSKKP